MIIPNYNHYNLYRIFFERLIKMLTEAYFFFIKDELF